MPADAKFRDMLLAIRADESVHREFNHYFCDLAKSADMDKLDPDELYPEISHMKYQENPQAPAK